MKSVILYFFFITFICNFVNVNVNVMDNSKERMLVDHGQRNMSVLKKRL